MKKIWSKPTAARRSKVWRSVWKKRAAPNVSVAGSMKSRSAKMCSIRPFAAAACRIFKKVQGSRFKVKGARVKGQGSRFKVQGTRLKEEPFLVFNNINTVSFGCIPRYDVKDRRRIF